MICNVVKLQGRVLYTVCLMQHYQQPNLAKLAESEFCIDVTSTGNRLSARYDVSTSVFNCVNVCCGYTSPAYYKNDIHPQKGLIILKYPQEEIILIRWNINPSFGACSNTKNNKLCHCWNNLQFSKCLWVLSFTKYVRRDYASISLRTELQNHPKPTSAGFACTRASMCRMIHGACVRENFDKYRVPPTRGTLIRVT